MPDLSPFDEAKQAKTVGAPLRIDVLLAELDDDQAAALRAALEQPDRYSKQVVADVVNGWGHTLSYESVGMWRRRNLKDG